ncbi:hypothetical protein [Streptomyces sp. DW26H14]|uniref:hypothetical protein n=1 Tax=Streptomyces sp. DW26H14 TaxID=3435395 RepID=UPI00403DC93E
MTTRTANVRTVMRKLMIKAAVGDLPGPDDTFVAALHYGIGRAADAQERCVRVGGQLQPLTTTAGYLERRAFEDWATHLDVCPVCATGHECPDGATARGRWQLAYAIRSVEDEGRQAVYR